MEISVEKLQLELVQLLDELVKHPDELIITIKGKPVARLIPYSKKPEPTPVFGYLKDTIAFYGDVISSIDENWEADADKE